MTLKERTKWCKKLAPLKFLDSFLLAYYPFEDITRRHSTEELSTSATARFCPRSTPPKFIDVLEKVELPVEALNFRAIIYFRA